MLILLEVIFIKVMFNFMFIKIIFKCIVILIYTYKVVYLVTTPQTFKMDGKTKLVFHQSMKDSINDYKILILVVQSFETLLIYSFSSQFESPQNPSSFFDNT